MSDCWYGAGNICYAHACAQRSGGYALYGVAHNACCYYVVPGGDPQTGYLDGSNARDVRYAVGRYILRHHVFLQAQGRVKIQRQVQQVKAML